MKRLLAISCLLAVSGAARASLWSDLWLTQDQQGQRLLDSGKAAEAARTFHDARRRAYAEIEAGQYADAAQRLEHFGDPQSQYNRGNALARAGKLGNALAAYDQAIRETPADSALGRDARHNRDLVAEQLKKQRSSPSKSGGPSQSGKKGQLQASNQGKRQKGNEQNAHGGSQQQNQQGRRSQGEPAQQRQASHPKPEGPQSGSAAAQSGKEEQDSANAKRDAEAAMAQARKNENGQANARNARPAGEPQDQNGRPAAAAVEKPPSEQTLALDQWLRQIPDDPSGLLRRKFLIEHLRREQESQE